MKAEPKTKTWVEVIYFDINPKNQKWENGESEMGKEENSV